MASQDQNQKVKDQLIEDNLRRAFTDKASEDVPADLLSLLDQLRAQDTQNDPE